MAEQKSTNAAFGFILGAIVVVLAGVVYYIWNGDSFSPHKDKIEITVPKIGN